MAKLSANKKIAISVAAFLVVIAVIVGILVAVGNKSDSEETEPANSVTREVSVSEVTASPMENSSLPTTSPAMNQTSVLSAKQSQIIAAYLSGSYYISAKLESNGSSMDVDMAVRDKDFQMSTESEGMKISIMYMNSKVYCVNPDTKKYIELSATLLKTMGMDIFEVEKVVEEINFSKYKFTKVDITEEGAELCVCHSNEEVEVKFIFSGDELKRIEFGEVGGSSASVITVNEFLPSIPSDMLTVVGLTKTDMLSFFGDMAS